MSSLGLNHSAWGPDLQLTNANADASHYSGNFGSNVGAVTGCAGPCNGVDGASNKAGWQYNLGQKGGMSYTMSDPQTIHNFIPAQFKGYSNVGVDNPAKLGAGVQWTPKNLSGGKRRRLRGGKINYFYGFPEGSGNQGVFAGSGYPEIKVNSQCGAGKRKSKHNKMRHHRVKSVKSRRRSRSTRKHQCSKNCRHNKRTYKSKKFSKRNMLSPIFKGGNYTQYTGNQAYSNIYSMPGYPISPNEVGLAGAGNFAVKPVNCGAMPRV